MGEDSSKVGFWKGMVTGKDNQTADAGRVLLLAGGAVFLVGSATSIYRGTWEPMGYCSALGVLLGMAGLGLKIKESTEPEAKP